MQINSVEITQLLQPAALLAANESSDLFCLVISVSPRTFAPIEFDPSITVSSRGITLPSLP